MIQASEPRQEDTDHLIPRVVMRSGHRISVDGNLQGDAPRNSAETGSAESRIAPRWLLITLAVICVGAMGLSGYLASVAFQSTDVSGCGGGNVFDCGHVLNSRWSKVLGLPVSVPAFGLYASCLVALIFCRQRVPEPIRRAAWSLVTICGFAAGLAAIWFISLQIFDIGHLCKYCLAAHSCGLVAAGLLIWKRPMGTNLSVRLSALSVAGVAVLMTTQLLTPPPEKFEVIVHDDPPVEKGTTSSTEEQDGSGAEVEDFEIFEPFDLPIPTTAPTSSSSESRPDENDQVMAGSPLLFFVRLPSIPHSPSDETQASGDEKAETNSDTAKNESNSDEGSEANNKDEVTEPEPRLVGISGGKTKLNIRHWPLLGSPDSKYCFVEMFDYTCPHCRSMHTTIKQSLDEYQGELSIIALPVPLSSRCNDTVRSTHAQHREACEIAELAVAVWRLDQDKFHQFHDWLFEPAGGRRAADARNYAANLVGADRLKEELATGNAGKYIAAHVKLYKQVGSNTLPKLLFERATLVGEVGSVQTLRNYVEGR